MSFFKKALRSAGKVVTYPTRKVGITNKNINKIGKKLKKVPIAGTALAATYNTALVAPIKFSNNVARSGRIDRAMYKELKNQVKGAQDLAPIAASVASFFPGIGTGIAGAIGAANALSKGKPISKAFTEGVKAATPGGYLAQGAYNIAKDIGAKKKPSKIQFDILQRDGVDASKFSVDAKLALNGDTAAMARLDKQLDKTKYKRAILDGLAVGYAETLQKTHVKGASSKESKTKVYKKGLAEIKKSPILGSYKRIREFVKGFPLGIGAMAYKQNEASLSSFRRSLSASEKLGFDAGVAAHIGLTTRAAPPDGGTVLQLLGYYITEGLRGSTNAQQKKKIIRILAKIPAARSGVKAIVKNVNAERGWWARLKEWLGV